MDRIAAAKRARENRELVFGFAVSFAWLAFCCALAYFVVTRTYGIYKDWETRSIIGTDYPHYDVSVDKELSATLTEDGTMSSPIHRTRCVRTTMESLVSGEKNTSYFFVDLTKRTSSILTEKDAGFCIDSAVK